ncbi:MAG: 2-oxoisovalerate dehydrogenase [Spirochaetia bacterium]|nr:2-oxoisovalerate dehydrogenase [Spirochaetia bacterium]
MNKKELIFIVEDAPEGGLIARGLGESIFAQAEDMVSLKKEIRDAVNCHFADGEKPSCLLTAEE